MGGASADVSVCMLAFCCRSCRCVEVCAVHPVGPFCSLGQHDLQNFIVPFFGCSIHCALQLRLYVVKMFWRWCVEVMSIGELCAVGLEDFWLCIRVMSASSFFW